MFRMASVIIITVFLILQMRKLGLKRYVVCSNPQS